MNSVDGPTLVFSPYACARDVLEVEQELRVGVRAHFDILARRADILNQAFHEFTVDRDRCVFLALGRVVMHETCIVFNGVVQANLVQGDAAPELVDYEEADVGQEVG